MSGFFGVLDFKNQDRQMISDPSFAGFQTESDSKFFGAGVNKLLLFTSFEKPNHLTVSKCGNYALIFEGEIANLLELFSEKNGKNYKEQESKKEEILLLLLQEYGLEILPQLKGSFAITLWNEKEKNLIQARDKFGLESLYWAKTQNGFVFGSDLDSIFNWGLKKRIALENLDELFFYRHLSGENTIFEGVYKVLPGHYYQWNESGILEKKVKWFQWTETEKTPILKERRPDKDFSIQDSGMEGSKENLFKFVCEAIKSREEPLVDFGFYANLKTYYEQAANQVVESEEGLEGLDSEKIFGSPIRYKLYQALRLFPKNWMKSTKAKKLRRYLSFPNPDFHVLTFFNFWYLSDLKRLGLRSLNLLPNYRIQILEEAKKLYPNDKISQLKYFEFHTLSQAKNEELHCLLKEKDLFSKVHNLEKLIKHIDWKNELLTNPDFREHLESMPENSFFKLGWMRYLDISQLIKDFEKKPEDNLELILPLFFHSLWYKIHFTS